VSIANRAWRICGWTVSWTGGRLFTQYIGLPTGTHLYTINMLESGKTIPVLSASVAVVKRCSKPKLHASRHNFPLMSYLLGRTGQQPAGYLRGPDLVLEPWGVRSLLFPGTKIKPRRSTSANWPSATLRDPALMFWEKRSASSGPLF